MKGCRFFVLTGMAAIASPAIAQIAPPVEDILIQSEIINRSVDIAVGGTTVVRRDPDTELDGEAGIYVLNVNQIFLLAGGGGLGYTSNPTRTASDPGGDWYNDFGASLGLGTRLGGAVDFGASVNLDGREYFDDDRVSSQSISGSMSAGTTILGPLYASVTAFGGSAFEGDSDNGTSFYGAAGNISAVFPVTERFLVRPGVGVIQQWSGESENDSLSVMGTLDLAYTLSPKWLISGRVLLSKRWYDDYYEDVTFVERRDENFGLSASLAWLPSSNFTIFASVAYEDQSSSFFLSEFDAVDSAVTISLRHLF